MHHKDQGDISVAAAVITVSTTRTEKTDVSGETIKNLLREAGIPVVHYGICPDRVIAIRSEIHRALSEANCIIITGGTGLTHDDCSIEAVAPLLDKKMDGFGELFRLKSYEEVGTAAILSRALGGTIEGRAVFCIPGSVKGAALAVSEIIIPEIRHILKHAGM